MFAIEAKCRFLQEMLNTFAQAKKEYDAGVKDKYGGLPTGGNVEKAKEFIHAGDAFQIVLSQRLEVNFSGSSIDLYRALRAVNPSPYMFCLNLGEGFSLVGCSPEVHVRAIDNKIDIRPIAGTRWRGKL